ncbi:MAG: CDP-diacylglycerol--glycerol-3-phosphate 3-phosphatidyltransferase [Myxococcales bacterium]|nr:CDP-diacylglycerol--glycerol-3-phosphate 3-phosphatidyltransferase [Myxococcales bacterium]
MSLSTKRKEYVPPRNLREEIWNLPNVLTLMRVLVIPIVVWLMLVDTRQSALAATLLFSAAAITDFLDGYIARKRGLVSLWGQFLDPLADKLIVMASSITLVALAKLPVWLVVILLAREIAITSLRGFAQGEGLTIHVVQTGKWKTALQLAGLVTLLIGYPYEIDYLFWRGMVDFVAVGQILLGISILFSVLSAADYLGSFFKAIVEKQQYEPAPTRERKRLRLVIPRPKKMPSIRRKRGPATRQPDGSPAG